jgi:hypothetical protein
MNKLLLLIIPSLFLISCNKEPGEGGTSSITGKVWMSDVNSLGQVLAEYYAADEDVYIMYGNEDQIYDDKFSTSSDGSYKFSNLTLGTYTVFAYSRCDLCASGDTIVSKTIEITEKKKNYTLENLNLLK